MTRANGRIGRNEVAYLLVSADLGKTVNRQVVADANDGPT